MIMNEMLEGRGVGMGRQNVRFSTPRTYRAFSPRPAIKESPEVSTQRDPLGLTPEQRRISDMSERYGAFVGALLADFPESATACPHCRQLQGHAGNCPTNMIIEGEWF